MAGVSSSPLFAGSFAGSWRPVFPNFLMPRHQSWWLGTELNRRHKDFQSSALPTELPSQPVAPTYFSSNPATRIFPLYPSIVPRIVHSVNAANEATSVALRRVQKAKRDLHLSKDGKWRSFPKVPNLLQYVISGTYYARRKTDGKSVRVSLETNVFTVVKLRLADKLQELRKPKVEVGIFADGRLKFEDQTNCDHTLAELSKAYRLRCVNSLLRSWPGLDTKKADTITDADCRQWAHRYAENYAPQFFNNTLNVFRQILALSGLGRDANPAFKLKRLGVRPKSLELPTIEQFEQLLTVIETSGAAQAKDCADLVRFLSFTGCRIAEMKQARWQDVNWQRNEITIQIVKRRATGNAALTRIIPLIPALRQLLERLWREQKPQPK